MKIVAKYIKQIMLISGLFTCTMLYAAFDPQAALLVTFGASTSDPLAELVVRNWGVLIFLIGAMLIYGAYRPVHRTLVIIVAGISKVVFIGLIVTIGNQYLSSAAIAIAFDLGFIILFLMYLVGGRREDDPALQVR